MARDFFEIIMKCVAFFSASEMLNALFLAVALGMLCWVACSYYTRLWHKRFHVRFQHHLLCALAAILTIIFAVHYRAVGNLGLIVDGIIDEWHENILDDDDFNNDTYESAYYTLKEMNPTAYVGIPEPGKAGSYIRFGNDQMQQTCVEIYVEAACSAFSTLHPFLNAMLNAQPGPSENDIIKDIRDYFRENSGEMYPLNRAIEIAADHIHKSLILQSPKTVWKTRLILVLLFLTVQMIPFGFIGYCAYKDLKIGKHTYPYQQLSSNI